MSVWQELGWHAARRASWPARAVIAVGLIAVLLVAAVPVALLAGLLLMLFGHAVAGLALFGASVLAAVAAVAVAGASGVRYLRGLVRRAVDGAAARGDDGPGDPRGYKVVRLPLEDYRDTQSG